MEVFLCPYVPSVYFYRMLLPSAPSLLSIPERIVSLVPSQTELLSHLGLETATVGITRFCIHPKDWHASKVRVGGTRDVDINRIRQLKPGLVIANKEENVKEQVEQLAKEFPVWLTNVNTIEDAYAMILDIGNLTGKNADAANLVHSIHAGFAQLKQAVRPLKVCYLIWQDPYISVGGDTFIHHILQSCGFINLFAASCRYPEVTIQMLQELQPHIILLSSEPYPFKQKHAALLQRQLPTVKILLVNGEMFSWYGSRMLLMPSYLNELIGRINNQF